MDYKAWIELLLTAVIGATAIYVALKQYRLERKRDRRELWDRRKTVYDAVDEFLNALSQLGHPRTEDINALARATSRRRCGSFSSPTSANTSTRSMRKRSRSRLSGPQRFRAEGSRSPKRGV